MVASKEAEFVGVLCLLRCNKEKVRQDHKRSGLLKAPHTRTHVRTCARTQGGLFTSSATTQHQRIFTCLKTEEVADGLDRLLAPVHVVPKKHKVVCVEIAAIKLSKKVHVLSVNVAKNVAWHRHVNDHPVIFQSLIHDATKARNVRLTQSLQRKRERVHVRVRTSVCAFA